MEVKYLDLSKTFFAFVLAFFLTAGTFARAQGESDVAEHPVLDTSPDAEEIVAEELVADADEEAASRRAEIIQEAVDALAETKTALAALDANNKDEALDALAMVTGKLKILVARDPGLALAPTDVSYGLHDIYSDREGIELAIEDARDALDAGRIQAARSILDALASELVVRVSNLPLATYPDAIAAVVPLIEEGNVEEAKTALQAAINTQVIRQYVFPLPVARAGVYIDMAEELAQKADRSEDESTELENYLTLAREHLEKSEVLGYGDRDTYSDLYAQLDEIETEVYDGKSGKGFFDLLRKTMDEVNETS